MRFVFTYQLRIIITAYLFYLEMRNIGTVQYLSLNRKNVVLNYGRYVDLDLTKDSNDTQ